jgi:hypothetical protein
MITGNLSSDFRKPSFKGRWQRHFINRYVDSIFSRGLEKTQKLMSEHKSQHFPASLFKFFRPTVSSLLSLCNQQLHLACPSTFNDPFDSYICIEDQTFNKLFLLAQLKEQKLVSIEPTSETISREEYLRIHHAWSKEKESNSHRRSYHATIFEICDGKSEFLKDTVRSFQVQAHREWSSKMEYLRDLPFRIACFSSFENDSELGQNTTM